MSFLSKLLREPLVHFVLIGAAVFGLYALVSGGEPDSAREEIVVTEGRIQQLAQVFAKTWQRPPRPEELRGLIDAYVKEEVYYREAVKLGLDRDDTLIRRRMQQKMEFLTEPDEAALTADDVKLQAYLDKNMADFRVAPRVAFEQVYIKPTSNEADAKARAAETLEALRSDEPPASLGDPTLLPAATKPSSLTTIERDFGESFARELTTLPLNAWSGPISSPYGLHLVRVTQRIDGFDPKLTEVRHAVAQKWRTAKREAFQKEAYEMLRSKYEVVLPAAKKPSEKSEAAQ